MTEPLSSADRFTKEAEKQADDHLFDKRKTSPSEEKEETSEIKVAMEAFKKASLQWEDLEKSRASYAVAYAHYKKEQHDAKGRVSKRFSSVGSFFLPKEIDVEQIAEAESDNAKKLKEEKINYDRCKYEYAENLKKSLGESDPDLAETEIDAMVKEEVIFDEYSRLRAARVEASLDDKKEGLIKKALEWYRKRPVVQRAAVSAVVGTGAFFIAGSVVPLIGIGSIAITPAALLIKGGTRFAAGIAVGSSTVIAPLLGKLSGIIKKIQPFENDIFFSFENFKTACQQYETGVLKQENTKRLATIGAAALIGVSVGGFTSRALGGTLAQVAPDTGGTAGTTVIESLSKTKGMKELLKVIQDSKDYSAVKDTNSLLRLFGLEPYNTDHQQVIKRLAELADRKRLNNQEFVDLVNKASTANADHPLTIQDIDREVLFTIKEKTDFLDYLEEKYNKSVVDEFKENIKFFQGNIIDSKENLYYFVDPENGKWIGVDSEGNLFEIIPKNKQTSFMPNLFVSEAEAAETIQRKAINKDELSEQGQRQFEQIQKKQNNVQEVSKSSQATSNESTSTDVSSPEAAGDTTSVTTISEDSWFNQINLSTDQKDAVLNKLLGAVRIACNDSNLSYTKLQAIFEQKLIITDSNNALFKHILFHVNNGNLNKNEWQDLLITKTWDTENPLTIEAIDKIAFGNIDSQEELSSFLHYRFYTWYRGIELNNPFSFKEGKILRQYSIGEYAIDPETHDLLWSRVRRFTNKEPFVVSQRLKVGTISWVRESTVTSLAGEAPTVEPTEIRTPSVDTSKIKAEAVSPAVTGVPAPAVASSAIELTIGRRGPEGAIIDYFKDSDNNEIAKKFGWDGKENISQWAGRKAHQLWLAQAKKALTDDSISDEFGSESSMRRIQSGTVVIEVDGANPEGGKMILSQETKILPALPVNHSPITTIQQPSTPSTGIVPPTSLASTDESVVSSEVVEIPNSNSYEQLLTRARVPQEHWNDLKNTLVKDVVQKGNESPSSSEGQILAWLQGYFLKQTLIDVKGDYTLKDLLASMVNDEGKLIVQLI